MGMWSMVRFLLCVQVLLALPVLHWLANAEPASVRPVWLRPLFGTWVVLGFLFQLWCTYRFTHGQWVA
jgi:hypothetical protein